MQIDPLPDTLNRIILEYLGHEYIFHLRVSEIKSPETFEY